MLSQGGVSRKFADGEQHRKGGRAVCDVNPGEGKGPGKALRHGGCWQSGPGRGSMAGSWEEGIVVTVGVY